MTTLQNYGYTETTPVPAGLIPGRITELQRERYTVMTEHGEVSATLKGAFYHAAQIREDLPTVGDFILLQYNESGVSLVAELLPRRTKFSRADFLGHSAGHVKTAHEQVVAANFDYVFIVTSLNRDFRVNRIVRYLTQANSTGAQPVVILTKADLVDDATPYIHEVEAVAPCIPVHAISSYTKAGIDGLSQYLQPGKTIVFLGMSGVGKSSLVNTLMDADIMAVKETRREDTSKGAHTTTHRELLMLPYGAMVIDTPGMRELGLYDAEEGIKAVFSDVEDLFSQCKFTNCRHETEPGCAVKAALADGTLPAQQWERYLAQKRESKFIESKTAHMRQRAQRKNKKPKGGRNNE